MRALNRMQAERSGYAEAGAPRPLLPRALRRPMRALSRIEWHMPRRAGLKATALLFLGTAFAGLTVGGRGGELIDQVGDAAGLGIDAVKITGQTETSELDILDRLQLADTATLITLDVDAARKRIEALPWVRQATLRKLYPNTLEVEVAERAAFALWRHGEIVSLIDREGAVISDYADSRYAGLPMVVGEGAGKRVQEALALEDAAPALKSRVRAAVLVAERRWNLVLEGGTELLLPEVDPHKALAELGSIDASTALLSRDLVKVDLRLADRMVVRLSPSGSAKRQEILKDREKAARKGGAA